MLNVRDAAAAALERIRSRPWGLAIAVIADDESKLVLDFGNEQFDEDSAFQIGSVTKTVTGLLVADAVTRGETSLDATVGAILGSDAGTKKSGPRSVLLSPQPPLFRESSRD